MTVSLPTLTQSFPIVDPYGGTPTPAFVAWWSNTIKQLLVLTASSANPNLAALSAYNTNGLLTQTAAHTFVGRSLAAGSAKISVTNANGVAGNPTVDLGSVASSDLSDGASIYKAGGTGVAVADGGTGVSTVPANGQLLIGNGTGYSVATLTAGANVTITNSAGAITIAATGGGGGGGGGFSYTVASHASSYTETATSGYGVIKVTASGQTVTLPTAVGNGAMLTFKLMVAGTLTIAAAGAETIDGSATVGLSRQYDAVTIASDNTGWIVI